MWCDPEGNGTRSEFANMPVSLNIDRSASDAEAAKGERRMSSENGTAADAEAAAKEAALAAKNARMQGTKVEGPSHAPGDYSVQKDVLEECQAKWGGCSIVYTQQGLQPAD